MMIVEDVMKIDICVYGLNVLVFVTNPKKTQTLKAYFRLLVDRLRLLVNFNPNEIERKYSI